MQSAGNSDQCNDVWKVRCEANTFSPSNVMKIGAIAVAILRIGIPSAPLSVCSSAR